MNDEQTDQQLRDWGVERRAHVTPPELPSFSSDHVARRHWAPVLATATAVLVVIVVAGAVVLLRSRGASDQIAGSSPAPPTNTEPSGQAGRLVLHDGDTVTGSGEVLALPGKAVRFCAPAPQTEQDTRYKYCELGLDVTGVDLTRLALRHQSAGRVVGEATLSGRYRDGMLTVTAQTPVGPTTPYLSPDHPPCTAPPGGWPQGAASQNLEFGPVARYKRQHPGAIVQEALLRPSNTQVVMYLLTQGDPAPVQTALEAHYRKRLCVTRSSFSTAQIRSAHNMLIDQMASATDLTTPTDAGGEGLNEENAQPQVFVDVPIMSTNLAALIDAQPTDLIEAHVWLAPNH